MYTLSPETPYFVLCYGKQMLDGSDNRAGPDRFDFLGSDNGLGSAKGLGPIQSLYSSEYSGSSEEHITGGETGKVLWSSGNISAHAYAGRVRVSFPPGTALGGFASGPECFPRGTMSLLRFNREEVSLPGYFDTFTGAKGMLYPVRYPRNGRILCVRTVCYSHDLHPKNHRISAGVSLTDNCQVETSFLEAFVGPANGNRHDGPWISGNTASHQVAELHAISIEMLCEKTNDVPLERTDGDCSPEEHGGQYSSRPPKFVITSSDHAIRIIGATEILLNPFFIRDFPKWLRVGRKISRDRGLKMNVRAVPWFIALVIMFILAVPGLIQYYGSDDNRWGDVLNQIIGTGSVLVGATFVLLNGVLGDFSRWDMLMGRIQIRNDRIAKLILPKAVSTIGQFSCDPRMPPGLIADFKNSAVRGDKSGWLKVGHSIRLRDMERHGYYVLKDTGMVLDILRATFYSCVKNGKVAQVILNDELRYEKFCERFDGDEVFE